MLVAHGANVNHVNAVSLFAIIFIYIVENFYSLHLISLKHMKVVCTLLHSSFTDHLAFYKQITLLLARVHNSLGRVLNLTIPYENEPVKSYGFDQTTWHQWHHQVRSISSLPALSSCVMVAYTYAS